MKWKKNSLLLIRGPLCLIACMLLCLTLCDPSVSSVHGISQARILDWVVISSSRGSSWPRDQTWVSCGSCIGRQILYHWATLELCLCLITKYLKVGNWGKGNERNVNKLFLHLKLFKNSINESIRSTGIPRPRERTLESCSQTALDTALSLMLQRSLDLFCN